MIRDCFTLTGKNALVTGSTRGLGAAIAVALAEAGANVAVHGRSNSGEDTCSRVSQRGQKTFFIAGDISDGGVCSTLVEKTVAEFGTLDILINNAGTIRRAPAATYSLEDWDHLIAANLSSVFRLSQLAGRHMLERSSGGKIVNIASLLSFQGGILVPAYAVAKGGVAQLTKAFANEWARYGINVNAIAPGYMETDKHRGVAERPKAQPANLGTNSSGQMGHAARRRWGGVFLSSPAANYIHGHVLTVDGGWLAR